MNWIDEIKNAAKEVMEILGPYYKEEVYEEALMHELRIRGIPYERQRNIEIIYKGYNVGMRRPDCILMYTPDLVSTPRCKNIIKKVKCKICY